MKKSNNSDKGTFAAEKSGCVYNLSTTKLDYKKTIFIGFAFMSIMAFWQMYDGIIPLILKDTFDMSDTKTGIVMALDNILALFLLPLFGSLSDKVRTRYGKRTPFILVGTFFAVVALLIIPYANSNSNLALFLTALGVALIAMGVYRSPAVALMPDLTPAPLRSKANAVINLMGAVGGVFALVMVKLLVPVAVNGMPTDYSKLFYAIGAFMIFSVAGLVMLINENKMALPSDNSIPEKKRRREKRKH